MKKPGQFLGSLLLGLITTGCGGGQEKGANKDLDRPRPAEKSSKSSEKGSKVQIRVKGLMPFPCA